MYGLNRGERKENEIGCLNQFRRAHLVLNEDYKKEEGDIFYTESGLKKIHSYYKGRGIVQVNGLLKHRVSSYRMVPKAKLKQNHFLEDTERASKLFQERKHNYSPRKDNQFCIYALLCPLDYKIKYVGKTTNLYSRYKAHVNEDSIHETNLRKRDWISGLKKSGLVPFSVILETCSMEKSDEREMFWINQFMDAGFDLLNIRAGSSSKTIYGGKIHTKEHNHLTK